MTTLAAASVSTAAAASSAASVDRAMLHLPRTRCDGLRRTLNLRPIAADRIQSRVEASVGWR
jgi:hypothetical protein